MNQTPTTWQRDTIEQDHLIYRRDKIVRRIELAIMFAAGFVASYASLFLWRLVGAL